MASSVIKRFGLSGYSGYSGGSGTGVSGYSGYSGSGVSGYSGSGVSGYSGYSGSGVSGYSGYSGSGVSGYSGYSGSGVSGYSGYSGSGGAGTTNITQNSHGFVSGDVIRHNGSIYVKAQADTAEHAETVGIVISSTINDFVLLTNGYASSIGSFTAGSVYFLSPFSAGVLTDTEPSTIGQISKPLFIATSTTSGYFFNFRGFAIPDVGISATVTIVAADSKTHTFVFNNGSLTSYSFV